MTEVKVTRRFPRIKVDGEKCTVPFLCKKCLLVCPTAVFHVDAAPDRQEKLKETDPRIDGNYVLIASRRDKCIMCNKCVEVCPVGAIEIEAP